jgi:hypothetical protein
MFYVAAGFEHAPAHSCVWQYIVGAKQWRASRCISSSSHRCRWSHACRDRHKYSSTSSKTFTYFRRVCLLCGGFSPPHDLVTLDFAQVVAFGVLQVTNSVLPDSGGALSSKDVTKAMISMGGDDGDDDPDKKGWKGIYAEL